MSLVTRPVKSVLWTEPVSSVTKTLSPPETLCPTFSCSRDTLPSAKNAKLCFVTKLAKKVVSVVSTSTMKMLAKVTSPARLVMFGLSTTKTPTLAIPSSAKITSTRTMTLRSVRLATTVAMDALDLSPQTVTSVRTPMLMEV